MVTHSGNKSYVLAMVNDNVIFIIYKCQNVRFITVYIYVKNILVIISDELQSGNVAILITNGR